MSNNAGNTLVAVLTGVAIGAGIGILFAPEKGSKTRKKIKEGFDDRMNLTGPSKVPGFVLADQNKTLKPITGGVRFRLANPMAVTTPEQT